jgi:hypothetical protein
VWLNGHAATGPTPSPRSSSSPAPRQSAQRPMALPVRVESKPVLTNSSTIHKIIMAANAGFANRICWKA